MKFRKNTIMLLGTLLMVSCSIVFPSTNMGLIGSKESPLDVPKVASIESINIPWTEDGVVICNDLGNQQKPKICPDGNGGAIITWFDMRDDAGDIYAQKVDKDGNIQWSNNGKVICNSTNEQSYPMIFPTGTGGAIITWEDYRNNPTTGKDIYAQCLDSNGNGLWGANGTIICNDTDDQHLPEIYTDGNSGAIIIWKDDRDSKTGIYAQKILSNGNTAWTDNGTAICNRTAINYQIVNDGSGGALIGWRDNSAGTIDVYAQRIDTSGNTQWPGNGTVICNATQNQYPSVMCGDLNGNAYFAWRDYRDVGTSIADVYVQKINSAGATLWDDNGSLICNEINYQDGVDICYDFNGGAVIAWENTTAAYLQMEIYAQRIDSSGATLWDDNGTLISGVISKKYYPKICSDGIGGGIIIWADERDVGVSGLDLYAQYIDANGIRHTTTDYLICDATDMQTDYELCMDGNNGAIFVWRDLRNANSDIFVQKMEIVDGNGEETPDEEAPAIPFGGTFLVFMLLGMIYMVIYTHRNRK